MIGVPKLTAVYAKQIKTSTTTTVNVIRQQKSSILMHRNQYKVTQTLKYSQGDHSPDNVKFSDNSLTVCGIPTWHSSC